MIFARSLSVALALAGGIFTSQLPEFAQQYRQRLGGAIDELNRMLADFDQDAAAHSLNRAEGIDKLRRDGDRFVRQRGVRIAETDARAARLAAQLKSFESAGAVSRIAVMAKEFDAGIAARAWRNFEPGVPVTMEGALSALVGFVAGLGLWHMFAWPLRRRRNRIAQSMQGGRA